MTLEKVEEAEVPEDCDVSEVAEDPSRLAEPVCYLSDV